MIIDITNNEERFTQEINNSVRMHRVSVMDAITLFCDENSMDIHDVIPLIGSTMKEKIRLDAAKRRMIKDQPPTSSLF